MSVDEAEFVSESPLNTSLQDAVAAISGVLTFPMDAAWTALYPAAQTGLAWWSLLDILYEARKKGEIIPLSGLRDVEIIMVTSVEEAITLDLRTSQADKHIELVIAGLTRTPEVAWFICQFTYDGLEE